MQRSATYNRLNKHSRFKNEDNGKTGNDRWLVSYADFITLLFGFFLVLYSVSQVNEGKVESLSSTLSAVFFADANQASPASSTEPFSEQSSLNEQQTLLNELTEVTAHNLNRQLSGVLDAESMTIDYQDNTMEISLDSNTLFSSGSADLNYQAKQMLKTIAGQLISSSGQISVEGHTDNIPIRSNKFRNNWQLSSARALAVVEQFSQLGIAPERLSAIGRSEFQPVADNSTADGRAENRRVVLSVEITKSDFDVNTKNTNNEDLSTGSIDGMKDALRVVNNENLLQVAEPATNETSNGKNASTDQSSEGRSLPETVPPVELKNGGLLFSRDPELPRRIYD